MDPSSSLGLADQIAAQVRQALVRGTLGPGSRLPAARQVAAGLEVNMHTVLRAYADLRDEGLVDLRRGRGAVIHADVSAEALRLDEQIADLARAARRIGWPAQDVLDAVAAALRTGPSSFIGTARTTEGQLR